MSRTFRFVAALAPAFAAWPWAAALAQCSPPPATAAVTVAVADNAVAYRLAATPETLADEAKSNGTRLGSGRGVLGLTVNRYDLRIRVAVDSYRAAGGYCASLRAAAITVGAEPEILMDGRFAPGTCQATAILDHESQHVAVFREAIAGAAPSIDATLRGGALPATLLVAAPTDSEAAYVRLIRDALDPVLEAARARAQVGNSRLDTPENYATVFRRCGAW